MKQIIILITVLFSMNKAYATQCATEVLIQEDYTRAHDKIVMMDNSGAEFSKSRVQAWNEYFGYELEQECIDIMDVETYQ